MDSDNEISFKRKPNAKKVFDDSDDSDKDQSHQLSDVDKSKIEDSENVSPLKESQQKQISNYRNLLDSDNSSEDEKKKKSELKVWFKFSVN